MVWVLVAAALAASPTSANPGLAAALPAPVTTAAWAAGVEEAVVRAPSWAAWRAAPASLARQRCRQRSRAGR
jgi:hypothetical protein